MVQKIWRILALVIIGITLLNDLLEYADFPPEFLFFTIPGFVLAMMTVFSKKATPENIVTKSKWSLILTGIGFFATFFTMLIPILNRKRT